MMSKRLVYTASIGLGVLLATTPGAAQQPDAADLAKQTQNPIANLISLPLKNNTSFGLGPNDRTQNVLNIQPILPVTVGKWNLINRVILPVVSQPDLTMATGSTFGLGDLTYELFFSPAAASSVTWGGGPVLVVPTATDDALGSGKWSAGPAVILVAMPPGNFVLGFIAFNAWPFAGDSDREDVNMLTLQYFVNYNLPNAWYLVTAPIITANWEADSGDRWIVPVGGGVGKIFAIGSQKINGQAQAFYNVVKIDSLDGPDWSLRLQLQFLFPKGR